MSDIAVNCTEDILNKVKSVESFKEKSFHILSEDDLTVQGKLLKSPFVGVMYEGIIRTEGDPTRQGLATQIRVTIALAMPSRTVGNVNSTNEAAGHLDALRKKILTTSSPTGHKWQFQMEVPGGTIGGFAIYLQRWGTMYPIVP